MPRVWHGSAGYLDAQGDLSGLGDDLAGLLQYARTGADDGSCGLVGRIEGTIERAYQDESWVSDMRLYEYDQLEERESVRAEALAEGEARGEARQTALFAAMNESGFSASEIIAALAGGSPKELYREYGIE